MKALNLKLTFFLLLQVTGNKFVNIVMPGFSSHTAMLRNFIM